MMTPMTAVIAQEECLLQQGVPLKQLNTWRVGGEAEYFIEPENLEQLADFFSRYSARFSQVTWLGLGSNMLISDQGLQGLVVSTAKLNNLTLLAPGVVYAQAGVPSAKLAKFCAKNQLTGGAFFAGIPGTIGGALAMNAGAFGSETWPFVQEIEVISMQGKIMRKQADNFAYAYRHVTYLNEKFDGAIGFLAGIFRFESASDIDKVQTDIRALLKKRNETQPIGTFNCGSVFRNPPGDHAARLIEFCGLKGKKIGGALVSTKHANFIINENNATAEDIFSLITEVKNTVFKQTGVTLVPEVKFLGWQQGENL